MRYNRLGQTGLFVSELCLGTMTFGGGEGMWRNIGALDQAQAETLLRMALEAGINFLDTADVYAEGLSERITGQAIRNLGLKRDEIVVATKGFGQTADGPNGRGNSRYHLIDACKASLKRLQLDHVDLYQIHGFDVATPVEETIRALETIVDHGHARYVGISNWAAWQIMKGLGIADRLGFSRFASLQAYYTVAGRDLEREIVPMLQSEGLGLLVWSPLAGGFLSGKYGRGDDKPEGARRAAFDFPPVDKARAFDLIDAMRPMAEAHDASVAQVAIAWLLARPAVTSVIVGAKREDQLHDNLAACDVTLTTEELATLDDLGRPAAEYPGWMFQMQGAFRAELLDKAQRRG